MQRQGQQTVFAAFGGPEQDLILRPSNVLQLQGTDLTAAHTVGMQHRQDRIVSTSEVRVTIHRLHNGLRLGFTEAVRHPRQLVSAKPRDGMVKALGDVALVKAETQKRTQCRLHRMTGGVAHRTRAIEEERLNTFGGQLRQPLGRGDCSKRFKEPLDVVAAIHQRDVGRMLMLAHPRQVAVQ